MNAEHRRHKEKLCNPVAITHSINRIAQRTIETKIKSYCARIKSEARSCERTRSERRARGAAIPVCVALDVTPKCMDMLSELMTEGHGLCVLKMCEARRIGLHVLARLVQEGALQIDNRPNNRTHLIAEVKPEVSCNLIVSTSACAKLPAQVT